MSATTTSSSTDDSWGWRRSVWLLAEPLSLIGGQIYFLTLAWAAVRLAGPSGAGMILAAGAIPRAILMLLGGTFVDRFGALRVAITTDCIRSLLMLCVSLTLGTLGVSLQLLLVIAVMFGVVDALFYPAAGALPPMVVPSSQLVRVQNLRALGTRAGLVVGAPLGGLLVASGSLPMPFLACSALFVMSTVALAIVRRHVERAEDHLSQLNIFRQSLEGVGYILRRPEIRNLVLLVALLEFSVNGIVNIGFPALALRMDWGSTGFGFLISALGVGAATIAVFFVIKSTIRRPGIVVASAGVSASLILTALSISKINLAAFAMSFFLGAVGGLVAGVAIPLIQANTLAGMTGRVMGAFSVSTIGMSPLSIGFVALTVDLVGLSGAFLVAAVIVMLGSATCLLNSQIRDLQLVPAGAGPK
ncbi:MFS transporter [Solwaraspora sp. WMMA2059]|uniref:MFS transporter n=1 Tax=Solwaraspora sp. WMMA2059 TaxID=3015160 RepID=UPI00248BCBF4|nr:MFS transporter [Solwaraspora sp. WMMA2059]WBB97447.1 MFS transporter [Solwaraspora sp. WMMA2059]